MNIDILMRNAFDTANPVVTALDLTVTEPVTFSAESVLEHINMESESPVFSEQVEVELIAAGEAKMIALATSIQRTIGNIISAQSDGGLTRREFSMISGDLTNQYAAFGQEFILPSMESMDKPGGRAAATTMALEGAADMILKVWNAVKQFLKAALEKIQQLMARYFSKLGQLESKAAKAKEVIANVSGVSTIADVIVSGGALTVGGKLATAKDIQAMAKWVAKSSNQSKIEKKVAAVTKIFKDAKVSTDAGVASADAAINAGLNSLFDEIAKTYQVDKKVANVDGNQLPGSEQYRSVMMSDELVGGKVVIMAMPKEGSDRLASITVVQVKSNSVDNKQKTLSIKDAAAYANSAQALAGALSKAAKGYNSSIGTQLISGMDSFVSNLAKSEVKGDGIKSLLLRVKAARGLAAILRQPREGIVKEGTTTAAAAFNYAIISAKTYKSKVKVSKEDAGLDINVEGEVTEPIVETPAATGDVETPATGDVETPAAEEPIVISKESVFSELDIYSMGAVLS